MESLERIWNLLEKIRDYQEYVNNVYPPILEFSSWIFQSVDTPKYENIIFNIVFYLFIILIKIYYMFIYIIFHILFVYFIILY